LESSGHHGVSCTTNQGIGLKYKFDGNGKLYFISFATVDWINVFIRELYMKIVVTPKKICQKKKAYHTKEGRAKSTASLLHQDGLWLLLLFIIIK